LAVTPAPRIEPSGMIGQFLDQRYLLLEMIGEGATGVVYRAHHTASDREVAVKVLRQEHAGRQRAVLRFANEAKIISQLRHPNTVRIYDCNLDDPAMMYIVMELLIGLPLSEVLEDRGAIDYTEAIDICDQVAASLIEAHSFGIVHRDVKPENVFIDRVGDDDIVKVLDFGIAKILHEDTGLTVLGNVVGTPMYISPEQARGEEVDARADIYALGVMIYHMIAGAPPFYGKGPGETIAAHLFDPPPPIKKPIPPQLAVLIERMLEKSPGDRPQSVAFVRAELRRIRAR
jgi:serine/threonine-protein kinase